MPSYISTCCDNHDSIAYTDTKCPCCEANEVIDNLNNEVAALSEQLLTLTDTIIEYQSRYPELTL